MQGEPQTIKRDAIDILNSKNRAFGRFERWLLHDRGEIDLAASERIRNVGVGIIVTFVAFTAEFFEGIRIGLNTVSVSSILLLTLLAGLLWILHRTQRYLIVGHLTLAVVISVMTFMVSTTGGFSNPAIMSLVIIPIGAALMLNARASLLWGALSLAILCGFWLAGQLGIAFPPLPDQATGLNALLNRSLVLGGTMSMILLFVCSQQRAESRMRSAFRAVKSHTAHLELLKEAAIAANKSSTVREAIQKCLTQICQLKGFSLAHGYDLHANSDNSDGASALYVGNQVTDAQQRLVRDAFGLLADDSADSSRSVLPTIGNSAHWNGALDQSNNPYRRALAEKLGLQSSVLAVLQIGDRAWVVEFFSTEMLEPEPSFVEVLHATGTLLSRILERSRSHSRIHALSYSDDLTGLPNRRHLDEALHTLVKKLAAAPRLNDEHIVLLQVGIDRFKRINEALGPAIGDRLLNKVSDRLLGVLAAVNASENPVENLTGDRIFRIGGDEFTILLEGAQSPQSTAILAQRILDRLAEPFSIHGHEIFATASIGIAISGIDSDGANELQSCAEAALAAAKEDGGAKLRFYSSSLNQATKRRVFLEHRLRRAITRNELSLNYQPLISATDDSIVAVEALLRWTVEGKRISPIEFIPIAESTGQIVRVGAWVLREACTQLSEWLHRGIGPNRIAINVSVEQLHDPHFVDQVMKVLADTGIPAESIELEITESRLLRGEPEVFERLNRLRKAGIVLALDDFGTGYSSLSQLKELPIKKLKIDRSFVDGIESDENNLALARAVIQIGRDLGLTIVAEGVENVAQAKILRAEGADELQGYLFSRPLPAIDIEALYPTPIHPSHPSDLMPTVNVAAAVHA